MFFVALCTDRPDFSHLRQQIESIRSQSDPNFRCLIQDDASPVELFEEIRASVADDSRFTVRRNERRLGVFHNFEETLRHVPAEAELICYCDQDDVWVANKLERQRGAFSDAGVVLCHTDLELIDERGGSLHRSCFEFEGRELEDYSLPQLLFRNPVTGCTVAFRRSLLEQLLPFPRQGVRPGYGHDLWTALQATQFGRIVALREPLVRHRQKPLVMEDDEQAWEMRRKIVDDVLRRPSSSWLKRGWRSLHLLGSLAERAARGDRFSKLALSALRPRFGRPNRVAIEPNQVAIEPEQVAIWQVPIWPRFPCLPVRIDRDAAAGFNVVVPSLKTGHLFGGVATALSLAAELARQGRLVRLVSSEHSPDLEDVAATREALVRHHGASDEQARRIEFVDGARSAFEGNRLARISADDHFVATAWWTALRVRETLRTWPFSHQRFIYLIQDYEPGFYSWSVDSAYASSSYGNDYLPIYNTSLLADYFRAHTDSPVLADLVLQPLIDLRRHTPPPAAELRTRSLRRLLVYGRPGTPRNLFPILTRGLALWIATQGLSYRDIEVHSAGESFAPLALGGGITINSLGKMNLSDYAAKLRSSDVGVSLMLSPHPSYPPLEMAASGMLTVTNRFANKDLRVSENIISCDPTDQGVAEGLREAWSRVADAEARVAGANVDLALLGEPLARVVENLLVRLDGASSRSA